MSHTDGTVSDSMHCLLRCNSIGNIQKQRFKSVIEVLQRLIQGEN